MRLRLCSGQSRPAKRVPPPPRAREGRRRSGPAYCGAGWAPEPRDGAFASCEVRWGTSIKKGEEILMMRDVLSVPLPLGILPLPAQRVRHTHGHSPPQFAGRNTFRPSAAVDTTSPGICGCQCTSLTSR
jgi:hypothetical protein